MSSLRSNNGPRIKYTPEDSPYEAITVDKLTPIIGAEIGGVDLRDPSNHQMDEIHRALAENLVIFFRDQHLSKQQHLDFGRKFGELHIHPAAPSEPGLSVETITLSGEISRKPHRLGSSPRCEAIVHARSGWLNSSPSR